MSQGYTSGIPISTDGTLSANSDGLIPSQKAVKTYVDNADALKQATLTDANFGAFANGLTAKTTPLDADLINIVDTADSNKQKKVTFTNVKAFLKTYFDTLYATIANLALKSDILTTARVLYNNTTISSGLTGAGSTSNNIIYSFLAPANTLPSAFVLEFGFTSNKTGVAGLMTQTIFHSLTAGALTNQLATNVTDTVARVQLGMDRKMTFDAGVLTPNYPLATNYYTDAFVSSVALGNISLNVAVDNYFHFVLKNGSTADTTRSVTAFIKLIPRVV